LLRDRLRPGGVLLAGFTNPIEYLFDEEAAGGTLAQDGPTDAQDGSGGLVVRHTIPYSDLTSLAAAERARRDAAGEPLSFGHTLEDQIGGQLDAGFVLTAMFEDRWPESPLGRYLATFVATRAVRPPL